MASTPTMTKPIRSPSYPNLSLGEAIAHVRKIEGLYRQGPVDREAAAKLIGFSGLSGPANQALSSLAHFGLVERAGKGEMRVTERARAILHPNNDAEKRAGLQLAAFDPQLFQELRERWPGIKPPEEGVATYLNRQGFNQSAIRPAAKAYLDTLLYLEEAGASESHGGSRPAAADSMPTPNGGRTTSYGGARVGDWINYESGGAIANPKPMRVRAVSDKGDWVFVDDSETGLEMEQVVVLDMPHDAVAMQERPTMALPAKAPNLDKLPVGLRKAMFPLDEGDVTLIFPEGLSGDGLSDLGEYLNIFLKKERKKAQRGEGE